MIASVSALQIFTLTVIASVMLSAIIFSAFYGMTTSALEEFFYNLNNRGEEE